MSDVTFITTCLKIFVIGVLGIMSPGPDFVLILQSSINLPKKKALMTALGIHVGLCFHIGLNIFGLGLILQNSPLAAKLIPLCGAFYLIWIGSKSLKAKQQATVSQNVENQNHKQHISYKAAFLRGFFCNILNFKALLFFLSLFTLTIHSTTPLSQRLVIGGILLGQSLIYWPSLVFLLQQRRIENVILRYQNVLNPLFGILLIGFGIEILWQTAL